MMNEQKNFSEVGKELPFEIIDNPQEREKRMREVHEAMSNSNRSGLVPSNSDFGQASASHVAEYDFETPSCVFPLMPPDRQALSRMQQCLTVAGLSPKSAQEINHKFYSTQIDLLKQIAADDEAYHQAARLYALKASYNGGAPGALVQALNGGVIPNPELQRIDLRDYESEFKRITFPVKLRLRNHSEPTFFIYSDEMSRHIPITPADFKQEYLMFLDQHLPDYADIPGQAINRSFTRMGYSIPLLHKSDLSIMENTELMFSNGIYDIKAGTFRTFACSDERYKFFTLYSINRDFYWDPPAPKTFTAILNDIFNGDYEKVHLAFQIIGALLTPTPVPKKLFLFQGVSNAGKTWLSSVITRLMEDVDTYEFPNLSGITQDCLTKLKEPTRVVYIQELGRNKVPSKQLTNLKSFSDSNDFPGATSFKILMNSNYAFASGEDGFVEPAIKNRIVVLPFEKPIDNVEQLDVFEGNCFEQERMGIILEALRAFSEVVNNGGQFFKSFPLNACVQETELTVSKQLSADEVQRLEQAREACGKQISSLEESKVQQVLNALFVLCDEPSEQMTASFIFDTMNRVLPGKVKDKPSLGKIMKSTFGERLKDKRINGEKCYNLVFSQKPEP